MLSVWCLGVGIWRVGRLGVRHSAIGTAGEKGTGLGLILCKEFIEQHGGEIWVESVVGEGSNFLITLPQAK